MRAKSLYHVSMDWFVKMTFITIALCVIIFSAKASGLIKRIGGLTSTLSTHFCPLWDFGCPMDKEDGQSGHFCSLKFIEFFPAMWGYPVDIRHTTWMKQHWHLRIQLHWGRNDDRLKLGRISEAIKHFLIEARNTKSGPIQHTSRKL